MFNSNNISSVSAYDGNQQTLDIVADKVSFMSNKLREWINYSLNGVENIRLIFKKGFKYLQEKIPICPFCGSSNIQLNGSRNRKIVFSSGEENFKIQGYCCKDKHKNGESQYFEANIDDIVPKNSNISYELIDTIKDHNAPVHAPVRVTAEFLNRNGNLNISHQLVQNIIFSTENPNEIPLNSSGRYTFDVLWCRADGGWNSFYFSINDVISKNVVFDKVYSAETAENLDEFFKAIHDKLPEEKYITVDLDKKYKKPLEKYGFKRQLCLKHAPKAINTNLKNIIVSYKKKGGKISEKDKVLIEEQKQRIIAMVLNTDLEEIDREFKDIKDNFASLHICVQKLMDKMIIPNFDDFFWYLKVDGVEKTSNTSELHFQICLPKHVKRRMRVTEGSERRIYLKNEYRNKKQEREFEEKLFDDLMLMVANNNHI
jgi:hypothetical protein